MTVKCKINYAKGVMFKLYVVYRIVCLGLIRESRSRSLILKIVKYPSADERSHLNVIITWVT